MRKYVLGAAALLALLAPGVAAAQSGHVGLSYSTNDDTEVDSTAISGSVGGANFQLDGRYASLDSDGGGSADAWTVGGHLFQRNDNVLWGGYLGYNSFGDSGAVTLDEWTIAGEMQYYADRTTFSGVVAFTQAEFLVDVDQWSVDGEIRHFVTDNFSFQGNLGYFSAEPSGGGTSLDGTSYGVGAEWQLTGAPVSIYGGWQGTDFDGGDSSSIGVGARWNWGGTLLERNRSGAGLGRPQGFLERFFGDLSPR